MRPRLLDLFCGAGGAGVGYDRADFEVVGVDLYHQPRYPFEFIQSDAMKILKDKKFLSQFSVIHASPPCQAYSTMTKSGTDKSGNHPRLIAATRDAINKNFDGFYVIENVEGARKEMLDPVTLCGTSFGKPLKRHRLFESNLPLDGLPCRHKDFPKNIRILNHGWKFTQFVPVYGAGGGKARELWDEVMDIDWMTTKELAESIPPYYTEFLGKQIMQHIDCEEDAA